MKMVVAAIVLAGALQLVAGGLAFAAPDAWSGSIADSDARVYDAPGGALSGTLPSGTPVTVTNWLYGPPLTTDNYTWADIGGGRFVHSSVLRHSPLRDTPPIPPAIASVGHWADVNLMQQILTLYDGDRPVHMSLMNSGRPGTDTETHAGIWTIQRRVADERMIGPGYDVSGVLFTQYFTDDAEALHLNYWLRDDERGIPRSHGCVGLPYADAAFAWRFLDVGSVVYAHA